MRRRPTTWPFRWASRRARSVSTVRAACRRLRRAPPGAERTGRPVDIYHSTEDGDARRAERRLVDPRAARGPRGRGPGAHRSGLPSARASPPGAFRSELDGLDLPDQLAELTELLDGEGYLAQWSAGDDGTFVLSFNNSAIWNVAEHYVQACSTELDFLRHVFTDAKVKRLMHRRDGSFTCGYEIRPITH